MNKLLLVDGMNLLFQMFFGMPARIVNHEGKAIQGTLGFVGALLKIIRMTDPTHVAVLFDGEHQNPRASLDENYKANRPDYSDTPEEETPFSQLSDVYSALDFLGISHAETLTCETDDWISGYANKYKSECEIVISSFDSDFFQLIDDNIKVLRYRGECSVLCDALYINQKFGISPSLYADFKSLTGDTADNVKGADKVGPKTAAWLINQFGSLEDIIANSENISKPSVKKSIAENGKRLRRNYQLIKLTGECDLPFELSELEYKYNGITTTEVLQAIGLR